MHQEPSSIYTRLGWPALVQIVLWLVLAAGYLLSLRGGMRLFHDAYGNWLARKRLAPSSVAFVLLCGGVVLYALTIGPVTATRYRVAMDLFIILLATNGSTDSDTILGAAQ